MANQPVFDNGGNEAGIIGSGEDGSASGTVPQAPDRSTNYDEIRKLIRIYQEKIRELEKQLPNGK